MMVKNNGQLYITGPDVIKAVTGEEISHEDLGGALSHSVKSGVTHLTPDTEEECIEAFRRLIQFLPQNNMEIPPDKPFDSNSIDKDEDMDQKTKGVSGARPRRRGPAAVMEAEREEVSLRCPLVEEASRTARVGC